MDEKAQEHWDVYTRYKEEMFSRTHTTFSPWIIVKANNKKRARLESMRYVLNTVDYKGRMDAGVSLHSDPEIVRRFHRSSRHVDD